MKKNSFHNSLFVHLRIHSEFSISDSIIKLDELIKNICKLSQPAVALTDMSNMFGAIKFYKKSIANGIKPIIGCDFLLENKKNYNRPYRVLLLSKNYIGYLNLCDLITKTYLNDRYKELKYDWLLKRNSGLIALSGGIEGDIGYLIESSDLGFVNILLKKWKYLFYDRYYIELIRTKKNENKLYTNKVIDLAIKHNLPVVATHPVQFISKNDFNYHEVRVCISSSKKLSDPNRSRSFTEDQYLLSSDEMIRKFSDLPQAIINTIEISKRCNLILKLGITKLPKFRVKYNVNLNKHLIFLSQKRLEIRINKLYKKFKNKYRNIVKYKKRLNLECSIIIQMGFSCYFLIVQDLVNWSKYNGIPVGPGRGSGAGSLVSYSLGITDIDPISYDLIFERFLNPERVSMPDLDIDFCQDNRERIIEYVKLKYGDSSVSQIVTFGKLGSKAVIRDTGRVLGIPYTICDKLSKLIPFSYTENWSLDRMLKENLVFKKNYDEDEDVHNLVKIAKPLEGIIRNVGIHAGGIIIAPEMLIKFCPLYCQINNKNIISQYDKDDIEDLGLVKFDFLGLKNLTILNWSIRYLKKINYYKKIIKIENINLKDKKTYKILCSGNTTAIFQLESQGMKYLIKKIMPNNFEDIIAILALYRPGPLESGMIDNFIKCKHGYSKINYLHKNLKQILKNTYGVIVYQEQIMLIAQTVSNYSLGNADLLRRAISKKESKNMLKHLSIFKEGAIKNKYSIELSEKLFNLIEKFSSYGFNKSHSAAYSLIAYYNAWLKTHYPAEFLSATLSSEMDDTDKIKNLWKDSLYNRVKILSPSINYSNYRFEPIEDNFTIIGKSSRTLNYGLGSIKGAGKVAIEKIVLTRNLNGNFKNLFDFCKKVNFKYVNCRSIEFLIKAGAFDEINSNRSALLYSLKISIIGAEQYLNNVEQYSLFKSDIDELISIKMNRISFWDLNRFLKEEKKSLGYYFSDHPFEYWKDELNRFIKIDIKNLRISKKSQWVSGIVCNIKLLNNKLGKFVILILENKTSIIEVSVKHKLFKENHALIKNDSLLIIKGIIKNNRFLKTYILAENIYDIKKIRILFSKSLRIYLTKYTNLFYLKKILYNFSNSNKLFSKPIEIIYNKNGFKYFIILDNLWNSIINDDLFKSLNNLNKFKKIEITY